MNNKCKACGGTLVFDAEIQMLVCEHCTSMFPIEETLKQHAAAYSGDETSDITSVQDELMDIKVYDCKNCGAELSINDVEAATYCAYCGQPTIVFSRIEKRKRPRYIIPFKITKNVAISNIREKIFKSDYVDDQIKHFKPELLRGIYVPYGLFGFEVTDNALLKGTPDSAINSKSVEFPRYYFRKAIAQIGPIPVDASFQLANDSADRLEPFFGKDLVEFDEGYLSGYYADLKDEDFTLLRSKAKARALEMFDGRLRSLPFVSDVKSIVSNPKIKCTREEYALLPVYFMIFENDGQKYTILVNGQTGKVVGAVPTTFRAFLKWFLITAFFVSLISIAVAGWATFFTVSFLPSIFFLLASLFPIYGAICNLKKYKQSIKLTTASSIHNFATERQDV